MTNVSGVSRKSAFKKVMIAKLTPSYGKNKNSGNKKDFYTTMSSIW